MRPALVPHSAVCAFLLASRLAGAPSASPAPPEAKVDRPPVIAVKPVTGPVTLTGHVPYTRTDSADAGRWKGVRAVTVVSGRAEVVLADGTRLSLKGGDVFGPDTVQSIDAGRIVLARRGTESGRALATVVIGFDGSGRGRVRVYSLVDAKGAVPPMIR